MLSKSRSSTRITGWPRVLCLILLGILVGCGVAKCGNPLPLSPRSRFVPATYFYPKTPGGTALRLAMVHDILHERYLRHGSAWYEKRSEQARGIINQAQKSSGEPSVAILDAMDDLAVALIMLHHEGDAVEVMRKKLKVLSEPVASFAATNSADYMVTDLLQIESKRELTPLERHRYSAHANLGTALIHGAFAAAIEGDSESLGALREGLAETERAIALNPLAHFGRENWQAVAVTHFLACIEHHDLLTKFTLAGQRLEVGKPPLQNNFYTRWAHMPDASLDRDEWTNDFCEAMRQRVPQMTFDPEWVSAVRSPFTGNYPFDEPLLGIIGMWTLGGGPNPHFALTIARMMEGCEQRFIAWDAYERACEFPKGFWPTGNASEVLTRYCRQQQEGIARSIAPKDPAGWQAERRRAHMEELAWGRDYQQAYQNFEEGQIRGGVAPDDPHFYDAFFKGRPSIASPVGHTDEFFVTQVEPRYVIDYLPCVLLGVGGVLLVDRVWSRLRVRRWGAAA